MPSDRAPGRAPGRASGRVSKIAVVSTLLVFILLIFLNMGTLNFHYTAFAADDNGGKKADAPGGEKGDGKIDKKSDKESGESKTETPCPPCPDPAKVVLEGLEEKRAALAREEERLSQEKKRLEKFKEEIDTKLENLGSLKQQINDDLARLEQKKTDLEIKAQATFDAKMDKLVKMYSGMKPKKAAAIVDKMDLEVAKQIFSRMRENSSAQILGFVDSEKAAKISERIAFKKK